MKIDRLFPHLLLNILTLIAVGFMLFAYNAWAAPSAQESLPGVISPKGKSNTNTALSLLDRFSGIGKRIAIFRRKTAFWHHSLSRDRE